MNTSQAIENGARTFVDDFAAGRIAPGEFGHMEHVRLGWSYLRCHALVEVLELFPAALREFAVAAGAPNLYHETITWAYLLTINERMQKSPETAEDFDTFTAANPDLLEWPSPILTASYREETLKSERARLTFVWPDRVTATAPRPNREDRE